MSWSGWLPYGHWPVFGDLSVTLEHLDEAAAGIDPLSNPESEFAYPRAVLALHHLGLQNIPANWLGLLQNICVSIGLVYVLRPQTIIQAVALSLVFFTPPILLGFERANLDFALFLLCAASASLWARAQTTRSLLLPMGGLILAAVLKLHPVFAIIGAVFAERGKRRVVWLAGLALLLAFWVFQRGDLGLIGQKVPVSTWGSWGCLLFFVRLERFFEQDRETYVWLVNARWPIIAVASYLMAAAIAFGAGTRVARRFAAVKWQPKEYAQYWIGAAICCGSFVGANLAYRWIFVLLAVPLLLRAARASERLVAGWSRFTLVAIAISLAAPLHAHRDLFLVTQAANWACVLLLIFGCAALRIAAYPQPLPQLKSPPPPRHRVPELLAHGRRPADA